MSSRGNTSLQNWKERDTSQTKKKFEDNVTTFFVDLLFYPALCLILKCMYQGKRRFSLVTKIFANHAHSERQQIQSS